MLVFGKGRCSVICNVLIVLGISSIFQQVVSSDRDIAKTKSLRNKRDHSEVEDYEHKDTDTFYPIDLDGDDVPSSSSTTTTNLPWIDLDMKLPALEEGSKPERISELNMEFQYDDGTPPTTMKIVDPNITWSSSEEHQILSIQNPDMTPIPVGSGSSSGPSDKPEIYDTKQEGISAQNSILKPVPIDSGNTALFEHSESKTAPVDVSSTTLNIQTCNCLDLDSIVEELKMKNVILKGEPGPKGDKGERGINGLPGLSIVGPKGDPSPIPYHLISQKGEQGPPGPIGPAGYCSRSCENGEDSLSGADTSRRQPNSDTKTDAPPAGLYKIVPGALVFPTRSAMIQMKEFSFVGTVAYVETDETFYGRVKNGWRSFSMGRVHRSFLASNYKRSKPSKDQVKCSSSSGSPSGACVDVKIENSQSPQKEPLAFRRPKTQTVQNDSPVQPEFQSTSDASQSKILKSLNPANSSPIIHLHWINPVRLIALNSPMTGNMGGINQINYQCQRQAMKNNVHGIFRAFLSFKDTMQNSEAFVVNLKNETVFRSLDELINNRDRKIKSNPPIFAFNAKNVFGKAQRSAKIWGDFNFNSNLDEETIQNDCQKWGSNDPGDTGTVTNILDNSSNRRFEKCGTKLTVLCVEVLHLSQVNLRHRNSNKKRLSFDKYLAILESYDNSLGLS